MRSRTLLVLFAVAALCGWPLSGACRAETPADATYLIILENGDSIEVLGAERIAGGFVRYRRLDGSTSYVATAKVREIRDASGFDWGQSVLRRHRRLGLSPSDHHGYKSLCFRGRDGSRCGAFLITEAGVLAVLDADLGHRRDQHMIGFLEYGAMKNVGRRSAVGLTVLGESGTDHNRAGVRVRYRRWLGHGFSLDLAPGIIVSGSTDDFMRYRAPGAIGMVAVDAGGLLAIMVEGEVARMEWDRYVSDGTGYTWRTERFTDFTLRAGVRGGSHVGVGATILSAIALAAIASSFSGHLLF